MKILFWLALIICGPCLAQPCTIQQAATVTYGADASSGIMFVGRWCKPSARWLDYTAYCRAAQPGAMTQAQQGQFLTALATRDETAFPVTSDTTVTDAACAAALPVLAAARPPAPVVVAKNGTALNRPAYVVIAATGARAATADPTIRADVGARAACGVAMIAEGTSTYCSWERADGGRYTNVVTLVIEVK